MGPLTRKTRWGLSGHFWGDLRKISASRRFLFFFFTTRAGCNANDTWPFFDVVPFLLYFCCITPCVALFFPRCIRWFRTLFDTHHEVYRELGLYLATWQRAAAFARKSRWGLFRHFGWLEWSLRRLLYLFFCKSYYYSTLPSCNMQLEKNIFLLLPWDVRRHNAIRSQGRYAYLRIKCWL